MRRRRREPRAPVPWHHDPRNPDCLVLRSYTEDMGFGIWKRVTKWMTKEESQRLSRQVLEGQVDDPNFPSWDNDPVYF